MKKGDIIPLNEIEKDVSSRAQLALQEAEQLLQMALRRNREGLELMQRFWRVVHSRLNLPTNMMFTYNNWNQTITVVDDNRSNEKLTFELNNKLLELEILRLRRKLDEQNKCVKGNKRDLRKGKAI